MAAKTIGMPAPFSVCFADCATGVEMVMISFGLADFSLLRICGRIEASKFATSQS